MRLVRQTRLHFREGNSDKVYEVDLCELNGKFLVNFRYGRKDAQLKEGTKTAKPIERAEADKIFQKLVDEKTRKGYHAVGGAAATDTSDQPKEKKVLNDNADARTARLLEDLQSKRARSNPRIERIIWRAGELKIKEAAPFIADLIRTSNALRDYCCAWALGFCGDPAFLPTVGILMRHDSDAVRRIAFEAALKLSPDKQTLLDQKSAELPEKIREAVFSGNAEQFAAEIAAAAGELKKGYFDLPEKIYVAANQNARPLLLEFLRGASFKPKYFKAVRHIFKIAEYRRDAQVYGVIAKRFETERANFHSNPWWDTIYMENEQGRWEHIKRAKELGSEDSRLAYSNRTRDYFLRRTWRTLRRLGEIADPDYVKMAVGALLNYSDADAQAVRSVTRYSYYDENGKYDWRNPKKTTTNYDEFAPFLLFNHILHGNSPRYELKTNAHAFMLTRDIGDKVPSFREETFPELWNAQPVGLLHLLSESKNRKVHEFAVKALRAGNADFIAQLDLSAVLMLLQSSYNVTAELGFESARALYDPSNPDAALILAVANSAFEPARREAFNWINAARDLFVKDENAIFKLLTSDHGDARAFAANLLQTAFYTDSQKVQTLIGRLISEMFAYGEDDREKACDLAQTLLKTFPRELRSISLVIVNDLLSHKLVEIQEFGGNLLLNHETPTENLPGDLINSLISSEFESIRAIGIRLFGQFPDENLMRRDEVFLSFLSHELEDIYFSIRPIIRRLSAENRQFADVLARRLVIALTREEERENLHSRFLTVLKEDLPDWTDFVDKELASVLVNSRFSQTAEAGGLVLQKNAAKWFGDFSTDDLIRFSNNEVIAVRQAAQTLAENAKDRYDSAKNPDFYGEVSRLTKALDAKWTDSRSFWFEFFERNLTEKELTPEIIVSVCDSVREDVQKFGRDLVLKYFKTDDGAEYMLKLSEHPSANMQLFVTAYLEDYAARSTENFARLAPFFVRALSLINRGRIVKTRALDFLENEGLKSVEAARITAQILARQSATIAVGDRARTIETMLKIKRAFPEIDLPIKIKEPETRMV